MKSHVHFRRQFAAFTPVTGRAGRHEVFPCVAAALAAGNDVVEGQRAQLAAAILAGVIVAAQNFAL